jgi:hypothetical protein
MSQLFQDAGDKCDLCRGTARCSLRGAGASRHVTCVTCGEYIVTPTASIRLSQWAGDLLKPLVLKAKRSNKREVLFITSDLVRPVRTEMVRRKTL